MRILSIFPGHNASICILEDGRVLLDWELERFSRIKHDYGYRQDFLERSLELCGFAITDIDFICVNRGLIDSGLFREGTVLRPFDVPSTHDRSVACFDAVLLGKRFEALAINHHVAHAASAFYTSPFEEAAIFTYDGYGDGENSSFAFARGNQILDIGRGHLSDLAGWWASVGLNNYRMPRLHEWDPGSHAGKIMALAAYGREDPELIAVLERDMLECRRSPSYPDARSYAFNGAEDLSDTHAARSQNLATALQRRTELEVARYFDAVAKNYPGTRNLCYAGGIALNCIANTKALSSSTFERLHVPPCPNDTGIALGMALYAHHHHFGAAREPRHFVPYTGPAHPGAAETFARLADGRGFGVEGRSVSRVADVLCSREPLCFYGARGECGPRALGSRSILCLPDRERCRDFLNFEVKRREWYRPYAPVILAEMAHEVLEGPVDDSTYMTTSARIREGWRVRLGGVNHVDHTTRPQVLRREHHPFLYSVIEEVQRRTGIPALVNTSFNLGEPIVETPEDAFRTFLAMPVRYLVTEELVIEKVGHVS